MPTDSSLPSVRLAVSPVEPSALECAIAALWTILLARDGFGHDDDFFALGGDSLLATRMVTRLRLAFGVPLQLDDVLLTPTVSSLAALIVARAGSAAEARA